MREIKIRLLQWASGRCWTFALDARREGRARDAFRFEAYALAFARRAWAASERARG